MQSNERREWYPFATDPSSPSLSEELWIWRSCTDKPSGVKQLFEPILKPGVNPPTSYPAPYAWHGLLSSPSPLNLSQTSATLGMGRKPNSSLSISFSNFWWNNSWNSSYWCLWQEPRSLQGKRKAWMRKCWFKVCFDMYGVGGWWPWKRLRTRPSHHLCPKLPLLTVLELPRYGLSSLLPTKAAGPWKQAAWVQQISEECGPQGMPVLSAVSL